MKRRNGILLFFALLVGAAVLWLVFSGVEYAYMPAVDKVKNPQRVGVMPAYDYWGRTVVPNAQRRTDGNGDVAGEPDVPTELLSPHFGAVRIDEASWKLGREAFYKETFRNEIFFTDILGAMDGPVTFRAVAAAIAKVRGQGTDNLQVRLASDAVVGGRRFAKGEVIDTGLDLAPGAFAPLGAKISFKQGRLRMGMTCAACHTTLDSETGQVIEGAPNADINIGLLIALATNSSAYLPNSEIASLESFKAGAGRTVIGSDGQRHQLPDIAALENTVDRVFLSWPPGNFDSTNDLRATPTSIPDSFTRGDHPYGWTGFAYAGPFRGLSMLNNNVHGVNADKLADREAAHAVHGIDREVFVAILLQNAASSRFRYSPSDDESPIEFLARVVPDPAYPVVNEVIQLPTYPKPSFVSPNGLWTSTEGYNAWEQVNAMSVFQNSLVPPEPDQKTDAAVLERGRQVFTRANCSQCHAGLAYTNNRIIPLADIGTEPVRSQSLAALGPLLQSPVAVAFDESVPLKSAPRILEVPLTPEEEAEASLAWAIKGTSGGYKVKGLVGLATSAPYLHDGGVAVGPDPENQVGVVGTTLSGVAPDPYQSLRALVDRQLRSRVVRANEDDTRLRDVNVRGIGHEFWVDEDAGYSQDEQEALLRFLLQLRLEG